MGISPVNYSVDMLKLGSLVIVCSTVGLEAESLLKGTSTLVDRGMKHSISRHSLPADKGSRRSFSFINDFTQHSSIVKI